MGGPNAALKWKRQEPMLSMADESKSQKPDKSSLKQKQNGMTIRVGLEE